MLSKDSEGSSLRVAVHADPFDNYHLQLLNQLNDDTYFDFDAVVVVTDQIDTLAELAEFDAVVLGTPSEALTTGAARALREYYQSGGGVVATGWFAFAYRGYGIRGLNV